MIDKDRLFFVDVDSEVIQRQLTIDQTFDISLAFAYYAANAAI